MLLIATQIYTSNESFAIYLNTISTWSIWCYKELTMTLEEMAVMESDCFIIYVTDQVGEARKVAYYNV